MAYDTITWGLWLISAVARAHTPHDVVRSYWTVGDTSFVHSRNLILRTDDDMANFNWTSEVAYLDGQVHMSSTYESDKTVFTFSEGIIQRSTTGGAHWSDIDGMTFCAVLDSDLALSPTKDFVMTSGGAAVAVTTDFTVVRSVGGGDFSPIDVGSSALSRCPAISAFEDGVVSGPMYL